MIREAWALPAAVLALASVARGVPAVEPTADQWVDLPSLPVSRQEVGVAELEGKVYVLGGILANRSPTGRVSRFDTVSEQWEEVPALPDGTALHHVGAASAAGKVYCIGGLDTSFRGVDSVFAYSPDLGEWERVASLGRARGAMGVAVIDDRIYAAGGQSGGTSFRDFEVYLPEEDRWDPLPPMPTARNHLAAAAVDGSFYAAGGRSGALRGALERFDPSGGAWSELEPMPTPRAGIAAATVAGKIFVFGGEGNPESPVGIFSEVEAYDPRTNLWETRLDMAHPRHGIGAAAVDDRIYVPGGAPVQGFAVTDVHDAFVPGTAPTFRRGDSNLDGSIDVSDPVRTLLSLFFGGTELSCEDAADTNDDGGLDLSDAVAALQFLFLDGPPPPAPGPYVPGPDPTDDLLGCEASA